MRALRPFWPTPIHKAEQAPTSNVGTASLFCQSASLLHA
jgi:hypothetical protein